MTRRLAQKIFNRGVRPSAAQGFRPVQRNAVLNYLRRIRKDRQPEDVMSELRQCVIGPAIILQSLVSFSLASSIGSTILSIAYGIKIKPSNDPLIALSEASNISINSGAMLPISTLMDIIPSLKYIPGWIPGKRCFNIHRALINSISLNQVLLLRVRPLNGELFRTICLRFRMLLVNVLW